MKEFMIKHPFITFLIIEDICIAVTNITQIITTGNHNRKYAAESIPAAAVKTFKEVKKDKENDEKNKVQLGFH